MDSSRSKMATPYLDNTSVSQLSADHNTVVSVPGVVTDWLADAGAETNEDIPFMLPPSPQTDPARKCAVVHRGWRGGAGGGATGPGP